MAESCKRCIHYEACKDLLDNFGIKIKSFIITSACEQFEDRDRFVKLPLDGVMYGVINGNLVELRNYIAPPKGKELFVISPETVNIPVFKSRRDAKKDLPEDKDE